MDGILPGEIDTYPPVLLRFPCLVFGLLLNRFALLLGNTAKVKVVR
jgi:hypothetical protein